MKNILRYGYPVTPGQLPSSRDMSERKRYECSFLPHGWKREELCRKSGISAGKIDVLYYSPSGKKYRSKPELARALGNAVDLTYFDFQTGKMSSAKKDLRMKKTAQVDYGRGIRSDALLVPPIRQTASIFKQPITLVKNFPDGKVKTDHKPGQQEKPKQLFWEKSLQGLRACDISEQQLIGVQLPRALRHVGPSTDDAVALQSLATALHSGNTPITGQAAGRQMLEKNPGVFMNPQQPLVQSICITEEDVRQQEERVCRARKTLENALGSLRP
ncbi:methyl-CpG-binding domain protein 2-like isoform X2 [Amphibalanus amphitrite]|uniref:methyl-CpG-binding domain protein 2-like isoform X2 n=1 Tax=Amphibalanus amphitrite TaxID=1232801 RepID=UPI001C9287C3|nr:methyl-CpG-binding domain protein 2-like isoform X2 [Amphibalanus amphitrite]